MKVHMYSQHIARIIKSVSFVCNVTLIVMNIPVENWKVNKREWSSQFPKSKERKPIGTNHSSRTKHKKPSTNFRNRMKLWKQRSIHTGRKQRQLNYSMGTDDILLSFKLEWRKSPSDDMLHLQIIEWVTLRPCLLQLV